VAEHHYGVQVLVIGLGIVGLGSFLAYLAPRMVDSERSIELAQHPAMRRWFGHEDLSAFIAFTRLRRQIVLWGMVAFGVYVVGISVYLIWHGW
jgi:hypothetical protein